MTPTIAEIRLSQLKNCFANIPQSLVHVLGNANALVQDVVVEIQYREAAIPSSSQHVAKTNTSSQRSVYVGWTGMASATKSGPAVDRRGTKSRDEAGLIEIDATFGRMLGLVDGQKVNVLLHLNPPLAHTVHIEPLTLADWEIIELHATFLESNLLFQVRALPNPSFIASPTTQVLNTHPLSIHLSPTSTANVIISSLAPPQASSVPFAKIAPDGEVIVAPKARPRPSQHDRTTSRSIVSRKSGGARSTISTRQRSHRELTGPCAVFLRPVDRSVCEEYFDDDDVDDPTPTSHILSVWADQDVLRHKAIKGSEWVYVSIVTPGALQPSLDAHQQQKRRDAEASEAGLPASKVVAKLLKWKDPPDTCHAALSTSLCSTLRVNGIIGGVMRLSAAPVPLSRSDIEGLKFFPFLSGEEHSSSLRLGGHTSAERWKNIEQIKAVYRDSGKGCERLLEGPITDGQLLPPNQGARWAGGIFRLKAHPSNSDGNRPRWHLDVDSKTGISIGQNAANPNSNSPSNAYEYDWASRPPRMVGVDTLLQQVEMHAIHGSSMLLTGGLGSGKTSFTHLIAHRLRSEQLFSTIYFSCGKLTSEETRVSTVKEILSRLLLTASWDTKVAGHSLIILDDLDKLCPVETELQTTDNGRSRQISELLCSSFREHRVSGSKTVILATAQSKESLHSLIIGANIVKEIVPLKVPNKDNRRQVLQALTGQERVAQAFINGVRNHSDDESSEDDAAWMANSIQSSSAHSNDEFAVDRNLDFLHLAGQTDGYMPGDLELLVSRAKNEGLIRAFEESTNANNGIILTTQDFQNALKGFTPASLRNVNLQSSKTTFDSIGGLSETRKVLIETLQYPTTYAPIFAQCPLRLRSGLLLYGYPGCGKTLLASAVAGECGLNFISVKGPEILNKYIGASEKSVRDLFERAESARPCVLFFDEFDSIAPKRGHDSTGVTDRVVNQLLTQMDGAEGLSGVYVLAATSRPDLIDPALLRPGRLDKSLLCDMPDSDDRIDILRVLSKKLVIAPEVMSSKSSSRNLVEVARRTAGYSGADLQAVIYNAHLEAIHDILGDHGANDEADGGKKKEKRRRKHAGKPDILQFRFGKDETMDSIPRSTSRAKEAAEYAAIISKLDDLKLAKKIEKQARRGLVHGQERGGANDEAKEDDAQKVVIQWNHIEASLATTRSSVGLDERRRLESIYREFIGGRSGEFSDGQGSTEVGGRTSLM